MSPSKQQFLQQIPKLNTGTAKLESTHDEARIGSEDSQPLSYDIMQDVVYVYRLLPARGIQYINAAAATITGYSREDFYSDPDFILKVIHPDDRPVLQAHVSQPDTLQQPMTLRWLHKNGNVVWMEHRSVPVLDEQGRIAAIHGIGRDITQQRLMELALLANEHKYRTLVEQASDGIYVIDRQGRYLEANPGFCQLLGYCHDELLKHSVRDILAQSDQAVMEAAFLELAAGHTVVIHEHQLRRSDGTLLTVETSSRILDEQSILGIVRPLDQRRHADDLIRRIADVSMQVDESFFHHLTQFLANTLHAKYALVGALTGETQERVKTIAVFAHGQQAENFEYDLAGTPCEQVMGKQPCYFPEDIQTLFPKDSLLCEMGAECYLGSPLWTSQGAPLGIIAVVGTEPLQEPTYALSILQIVAGRAAAELERMQTLQALGESEGRYRHLFENNHIVQLLIDPVTLQVIDGNPAAVAFYGYPRSRLTSLSIADINILPEHEIRERMQEAVKGSSAHTFRHRLANGELREVEVYASPVMIQGKRLIHILMVDITEHLAVQREIEQRNRELAVYSEVIRAASSTLDAAEILEVTCRGLQSMLSVPVAAAALFDSDSKSFTVVAEAVASSDFSMIGTTRQLQGADLQLLNDRQPILFPNARHDERLILFQDLLVQHCIDSLIALPLANIDQVVGFVGLAVTEPRQFSNGELAMAANITAAVSQALQNATLIGTARQRAEYLATLNNASTRLSQSSLGLDVVLRQITSILVEEVGAAFARLWLVDETGEELILRASAGLYTHIDGSRARIRIADDCRKLGQVARARKAILTNEVRSDEGFDRDWARSQGLVAFAGYPLIDGDRLVGVIALFSRTPLEHVTLDVLGSFASHASAAICNAQLYEAERHERLLAQTLQRSAEALVSTVGLEDTLGQLLEQLHQIVSYDSAAVLMVEEENLKLVAHHGDSSSLQIGDLYPYTNMPSLGNALIAGVPIVIPDIRAHSGWQGLPWMSPAVRSWIGIPLVGREVVSGFLSIGSTGLGSYGPSEVNSIASFARQAALAIENSRILIELEARVLDLRQAQAHLERTARLSAAGEMAAGVAHQINNPLTAVIAEVQMLLEDLPPDHPGYVSAKAIREAAHRAGTVVQRMLDFVRASNFKLERVDINDSLHRALSLVRSQIEGCAIKLILDLSPDLPAILGSPPHLEDVWLNLVLNARDAITGLDQPRIQIVTCLKAPENIIEITIEDNGPGIVPENLSHIFDPFFTTKDFGTGLGLSICQDIVSQHRGSIRAENCSTGGARFIIQLPVLRENHG